mgnify:CR=1 FL=1|tara:strand:- start:900 stop:2126 length:1227 start_codon:yes stop_codon:yes gene_type:complete
MKKLKVLSLFNGMNCIGMALKSLNIEAQLYCSEIDKYANKISSLLFPEAVNLGCVKTVKISDIGKIDLLVAGSPCQGFSFAGKQLNFEDERSKLFFEFIRILEEARKINPEVKFLLENVKMSKEHQAVISRFCGIDPIEINSALLSAQNRRRLYWTNIGTNKNNLFGIEQIGIEQPADKGILLKDILEETAAEKYFLKEKTLSYFINNSKKMKSKGIGFSFTPDIGNKKSKCITTKEGQRMENNFIIIPEAAALTEVRTEEAKEIRRKTKTNPHRSKKLSIRKDGKMNCLTAAFSKEQILIIPEATKKGYTEIEEGECFDMLHPNSKTRRGRKMKDKSNCLTIVQPEFYRYQNARIRRLTPLECCRLQTIPEEETEKILSSGVSDSQIYKMLGNGWTVSVIAYILKHL